MMCSLFYFIIMRQTATAIKKRAMSRLTIRCLVRTSFAGCVCGGLGGGRICCVPQTGHIRTPSRSIVPQVLQIIVSSPQELILCFHNITEKAGKKV